MAPVNVDAYQTDAETVSHGCIAVATPTQVASQDLRISFGRGSSSMLPPVNGGFSWLSRYLIAAFGNVPLNGIGNAWMTLKLCSRLGSPRAS